MERYVERKKQRNQAGQTRNGMGWVLFGVVPQSSPLALFIVSQRESRDFRIHGTIREYYPFIASPYEFTVFIIRYFAVIS